MQKLAAQLAEQNNDLFRIISEAVHDLRLGKNKRGEIADRMERQAKGAHEKMDSLAVRPTDDIWKRAAIHRWREMRIVAACYELERGEYETPAEYQAEVMKRAFPKPAKAERKGV